MTDRTNTPPDVTAPARAVLYMRVSTSKQAERDLSIPDQRRQMEAYCAAKGWQIVGEFVDPGLSGTIDNRPQFQRMLDIAASGDAPFDMILVHSFSRFARDTYLFEYNLRRIRKRGIRLLSITQELNDDPTSEVLRQILTVFDGYQSTENAKHVIRSMKDNARQGFWNGSQPPLGYRTYVAEERGAKAKK